MSDAVLRLPDGHDGVGDGSLKVVSMGKTSLCLLAKGMQLPMLNRSIGEEGKGRFNYALVENNDTGLNLKLVVWLEEIRNALCTVDQITHVMKWHVFL